MDRYALHHENRRLIEIIFERAQRVKRLRGREDRVDHAESEMRPLLQLARLVRQVKRIDERFPRRPSVNEDVRPAHEAHRVDGVLERAPKLGMLDVILDLLNQLRVRVFELHPLAEHLGGARQDQEANHRVLREALQSAIAHKGVERHSLRLRNDVDLASGPNS